IHLSHQLRLQSPCSQLQAQLPQYAHLRSAPSHSPSFSPSAASSSPFSPLLFSSEPPPARASWPACAALSPPLVEPSPPSAAPGPPSALPRVFPSQSRTSSRSPGTAFSLIGSVIFSRASGRMPL